MYSMHTRHTTALVYTVQQWFWAAVFWNWYYSRTSCTSFLLLTMHNRSPLWLYQVRGGFQPT